MSEGGLVGEGLGDWGRLGSAAWGRSVEGVSVAVWGMRV